LRKIIKLSVKGRIENQWLKHPVSPSGDSFTRR
jgi:hypothetical protein